MATDPAAEQLRAGALGRLHFRGDVRGSDFTPALSPRHGFVRPSYAEYDETADVTTVYYEGRESA